MQRRLIMILPSMTLSSISIILFLIFATVSGFVNIPPIALTASQERPAVAGGGNNVMVMVCCRRKNTSTSSFPAALSLAPSKSNDDIISIQQTRRDWMQTASKLVLLLPTLLSSSLPQQQALAIEEEDSPTFTASREPSSSSQIVRIPTDATSGSLPDLPPEAVRSYLQYRFPLQLAADYFLFDLQTQVADVDEYGNISDLLNSQGGGRGGQGGSSRLERDFVNPMRIIGLSMPPDVADDLRSSQFQFEKAMSKLKKCTSGIRRDLPVEIDINVVVPQAKEAWEEGRLALNSYFETLNNVTGLKGEMVSMPSSGPNQVKEYGRSIRRYNEFMKKTKLCQNRGGPTLSAAWGQLMVSGYMQDSCGVEPLEGYFFQ